jgi:hypothetical protein
MSEITYVFLHLFVTCALFKERSKSHLQHVYSISVHNFGILFQIYLLYIREFKI